MKFVGSRNTEASESAVVCNRYRGLRRFRPGKLEMPGLCLREGWSATMREPGELYFARQEVVKDVVVEERKC